VISQVADSTYTKTLNIGPSAIVFSDDAAALFTTNDTHCPPISYQLKLDDTTLEAAIDPSSDDSLNFYLTGSTLNLFAQTEKVHTFFIYAASVTSKFATKKTVLTVQCVVESQTITLSTAGSLDLVMEKNSNPIT
jgi:hypothetical protein